MDSENQWGITSGYGHYPLVIPNLINLFIASCYVVVANKCYRCNAIVFDILDHVTFLPYIFLLCIKRIYSNKGMCEVFSLIAMKSTLEFIQNSLIVSAYGM